eukprot:CAMPEP_0172190806 /NCGR_PEP_ID=MMETSP1050-20130122/23325_1 /TAXON_ID=233186 /ORGANISM="Cryptomonas curvata, Strain CCAP979/52" /LENGTH=143 /DNA_ID=CAMNT_0012865735 /DNA_START=34 /DNA_END=461 /DNA_ORIENTATION=-
MSSPPKEDHHFSHYTFGINWLDPFSPSFSPRSQQKPANPETAKKGSRRLYFGSPSLVPPSFSPPHPIIWDGTIASSGRKINVRNFNRHFASFQPTEINERVVDSLEKIGEYRKPIWYSSMIASAAPIMFEHDIVFLREELIDG